MHVVLVSCCEKKAIKRTRAVLDSYARRTGDRTWLTPITTEGLSELHKILRKTATRQTSVACFRNDGRKRMRLLWTVGNSKNFDKDGTSPIATQQKKAIFTMPEWAKLCAVIAETAGFMHDLGKFNEEFQEKLKTITKNFEKDNVRHEWLSMFLANSLFDGYDWKEAVNQLENNHPVEFCNKSQRQKTLVFEQQLASIKDAVLFCVATHHKLPSRGAGKKKEDVINNEEHVNFKDKTSGNQDRRFKNPRIRLMPSEKLLGLIQRNIKKIAELSKNLTSNEDPVYWRMIATFSRMALILADQSISAEVHVSTNTSENATKAYANTHNSMLNQDLSWHLEYVGVRASRMIFHMLNIPLPSLSQDTLDQINRLSSGRYEWQNKAAIALSNSRAKNDVPHLVLNIASTGSGKTRMNLRTICALNEDKPVRLATALNLRTLTLQTGDAYHEQAGISKEEMACVIGDALAKKLHECGRANVDEDEAEYSLDVIGDFDFDMPDWLRFYSNRNPKLGDIIGAPILVSTIDFLISAGEPHRKHHHILAAMRIMYSDLILDEIDGYEPTALLAVLRLVMMSAIFGRNVVASSATLSKSVARMLWEAYHHGAKMRANLNKEPILFRTAIIDDLINPSIASHDHVDEFMKTYISHVNCMLNKLEGKCYRKPVLAEITIKDEQNWLFAIAQWAKELHDTHAWVDDKTGKKLSFGLIRIANIRIAVKVAKDLADKIPNSRIVCYHANHFPIQRFHIERNLDFLLNRKNKNCNAHILADKEIRKLLDNSENDIQFIVVATPVEEIGRDHDFDWAIIEPSSSQSIVQTAGRVNRHRLINVTNPNVAILQYCYKEVKGGKTTVFTKPGLEIELGSHSTHSSHDLKELFDWEQIVQIDAKMRFQSNLHLFSKFDDHAIEQKSKDILDAILTKNHLWMAKETYTESSLRSSQPTIELQYLEDSSTKKTYKISSKLYKDGEEENSDICESSERLPNDWLIKDDNDLIEDVQNYEINDKNAMTVSISWEKSDKKPSAFAREKICRHKSFGFYIQSKS